MVQYITHELAGIGAAEAEKQPEAELEQRVFGPAQPVRAGGEAPSAE